MNQSEEESLYRSLEEEAIDVDCLLVEPRSDQVSVSGVWCLEEDTLGKCIKSEDVSYELGFADSHINMEGVDTTKLNALDVLPHEVGVESLLATNDVSACDDYHLDIGFVEHAVCIDYSSNEGLHVGNSCSESQILGFNSSDKGSFGIPDSLTENIPGPECQDYFFGKTTCDSHSSFHCNCVFGTSSAEGQSTMFTASFESKSVYNFEDVTKSFIHEVNNEVNLPPHLVHNGKEVTPVCRDVPMSSAQGHGIGAVTLKRSRKPTKRYIDESSSLILKNCKKRRETSSMSKAKMPGVRCSKHHHQMEPKAKAPSSEISFGKAIQVPFISQAPTECQKNDSSTVMENHVENYSTGSEDDSETTMRSMAGGSQRKLHRLWTVAEVKKLIDGVAHFGVGKWTHIKKLLFSSSVHRTPVDLKDKWRNLLKASSALKGNRIEDEQKRSQPWRPLPKSILCRVRELASVYPYPREGNSKISKSKFPLARHVSSPARIKGNQVPVL